MEYLVIAFGLAAALLGASITVRCQRRPAGKLPEDIQ